MRALVLESGISEVHERLALRLRPEELGVSEDAPRGELAARFDHRAKMVATRCPVLVLHTLHDGMVGRDHADRRLAEWAGPRGELVVFPNGDHKLHPHAFNGDAIVRRDDCPSPPDAARAPHLYWQVFTPGGRALSGKQPISL